MAGNKRIEGKERTFFFLFFFLMSAFYNPWINGRKIIREFCAITLSPSCLVLGGVGGDARTCPLTLQKALIQEWISTFTFRTIIISFKGDFLKVGASPSRRKPAPGSPRSCSPGRNGFILQSPAARSVTWNTFMANSRLQGIYWPHGYMKGLSAWCVQYDCTFA